MPMPDSSDPLTRLRISCRGALSICDVTMHMHYTYFYTIRSIIHADYREPQEHEALQQQDKADHPVLVHDQVRNSASVLMDRLLAAYTDQVDSVDH